jgi:vitamin B12 transporter
MKKSLRAHAFAPALSVLSLALASAVQAQTVELEPVVVSASLLEQLAVDALPATTLITRQDIDKSQAVDLPSLLRQQAGIELGQLGGPGGVATAFVRGAESRHLVVLIDGLPTSSLHFGLAALEHLSLSDVQRIEVVRGNVSSIYGSSAMGGMIQIFTERKTSGPWVETKVEFGSRGHRSGQLSTGVNTVGGLQVSGAFETLDGGNFNSMNQSQVSISNPDSDGYKRTAGSVRISQHWEKGDIAISSRESQGQVRYDSRFGPASQADESIHVIRSTQITTSWRPIVDLTIDASIGVGEDRLNTPITYVPYFVFSKTKMLTSGIAWRLDPGHALTAGFESKMQSIESNTVYGESKRELNSYRAGYQYYDERNHLQINVRQDRYSGMDAVETGYAGYAFHVTPAWRIKVSSSTGFMAPNFNDLYYPAISYPGCTNCYGGNPNLKPERSQSHELGLQYVAERHDLRLTLFDNRYSNLIATDTRTPYGRINIASARNDGFEILYRGQWDKNQFNAGLTLQDPRDLSTGEVLSRRAKTLLNFAYFRKLHSWEAGAQMRYQGSRLDSTNRLDSFKVIDFLLSRKISTELSWYARVENAFDRDYQTNYGYNTHGRGFFTGFKWTPKI